MSGETPAERREQVREKEDLLQKARHSLAEPETTKPKKRATPSPQPKRTNREDPRREAIISVAEVKTTGPKKRATPSPKPKKTSMENLWPKTKISLAEVENRAITSTEPRRKPKRK